MFKSLTPIVQSTGPRHLAWAASCLLAAVPMAHGSLFADGVVSFSPGLGADPNYADPASALGSPARFTGTNSPYGAFPSVVSMFSPPFDVDQVVSIGEGGHLTLRFDTPIDDSPSHLFGVDFIVFGNTGFADVDYPQGQIGSPPYLFGRDRAMIEVSENGVDFHSLGLLSDRSIPTQGYLDSGPYDAVPGSVLTDFHKPMNPALAIAGFSGLSFGQAMTLYDSAGGGAPFDIQPTGLSSVSYVRIRVPDDGDPNTFRTAEIDAISLVPEPMACLGLFAGLLVIRRRSREEKRSGKA